MDYINFNLDFSFIYYTRLNERETAIVYFEDEAIRLHIAQGIADKINNLPLESEYKVKKLKGVQDRYHNLWVDRTKSEQD